MATSGSKSISVTSYDTLKFSWSQTNQSIANNTTTISWKLELIATSYGRIDSSVSKSWSVTVNGTKYSGTNTVGIGNNSTKTLASGSTTITHKSDGTMSFSYAFTQEFAITFSGTYIDSKSGSGTGTLNTIPRASSFGTITGNTIGSSVTVNINRNSTSFTHHLYYKVGNSGWVDLGSGITISKTFTIDLYRCQEFPNATSGTMQIKMITYNGSAKIGSDVTKTMTVYVPDSVVPTISSVTVSEGGTLVPSSWGVYVQNKSQIKFVTSASGIYGSTISSVKVAFNNANYTGSTVTTGIISTSGTLTATITVTDTRGRTKSTTKSVTIQPYCNPHATVSAERTTGTSALISIDGAVSSVSNKNTYTYSLKYKKSTATSYTTRAITGAYSLDTDLTLDVFDTESSYDLYIQVTDYFTTVTSAVITLSSEYALIDYLNGGKGMAFGKVAELEGYLDVALKLLLRTTNGNFEFDDSGWIVPTLSSNFTLYDSNEITKVKYRKIGKTVEVRGVIKPTSTIAGSTTNYTIFTLPTGFKPSSVVYQRCQGSDINTWLCSVDTNGNVRFGRYGNGTSYLSIDTSTWLPFTISFFID